MNQKQILYDLFQAYYDARKNKRNTLNQLDFEYNLESNILKLRQEIITGIYEVGRSIYFIQNYPVKREVFAGDFRDRVVHHLVYNYISPIFEKEFIYDSYSCRKGKGTSFGIKRIQKFIRSCSENYTKDCYILKLDISGYFMSMNKDILWEKINKPIQPSPFLKGRGKKSLQTSLCKGRAYKENFEISLFQREYPKGEGFEKQIILQLIQKIIFNDPTKNSLFKGKKSDYLGLPKNKSLFFAKPNSGLPIGNLTSQLFSNIYLSDFDKYIKNELGCKYYGRYVDDFVIIHKDKEFLVSIISKISDYLQTNLCLTLHPNKIYLQHYYKGVLFLGAFIKPHRTYIRKRTIGNFYEKIQKMNNEIKLKYSCHYLAGLDNPENYNQLTRSPCQARGGQIFKSKLLSIINSYLGFLKHYKSYGIRKKLLLQKIHAYFWNEFYVSGGYSKIVRKRK